MPDPTPVSSPPSPTSSQPPPGPPVGSATPPNQPAPTEKKPDESQADFALRLVREQRRASKFESEAKEARRQLEALTKERDEYKTRVSGHETAGKAWQERKYVDAIRSAFGVKGLPEDLLVELASAETAQPEQMTPEQMREHIRAELKAEQEAARAKEEEEERERSAKMQEMRVAAVQEVAETLTATPDKWPTVWALGVSGDQIASQLDELVKSGKEIEPAAVFDALEKEYRERVLGLPYLPKQEGGRTFGADAMRGPADSNPRPAAPEKAKERWEWRKQRDEEWRKQKFGG
jgi:hypothetical protein